MGWFGKLTLGSLGLLVGGPIGAVAGAALGHHLFDRDDSPTDRPAYTTKVPRFARAEQTQATYFISLFSILGKLAKIDGVVARDEIAVVERFISGLQIDDQEKMFAKRVFNEAKQSEYAIEDFADEVYRATRNHPTVHLSFFDLLFKIVAADGTFHPAEEAALKKVKTAFKIDDRQYGEIKAVYFKDLEKYYRILQCSSQSSDQEIKSGYKKLVKDFHPDTIVSKGFPEEFTEFATNRFREIQEAYEKIKLERGLK